MWGLLALASPLLLYRRGLTVPSVSYNRPAGREYTRAVIATNECDSLRNEVFTVDLRSSGQCVRNEIKQLRVRIAVPEGDIQICIPHHVQSELMQAEKHQLQFFYEFDRCVRLLHADRPRIRSPIPLE